VNAKRVGDFVLYIAIGLAFVAAAVWVASHTQWLADTISKWVGFGVNTLLIFTFVLKYRRSSFKRPWFWATISAFLSIHLLLFIRILQIVERWPLMWWVPIGTLEIVLITTVLMRLGYRESFQRKRRNGKNQSP
jgi:hypothetical protein